MIQNNPDTFTVAFYNVENLFDIKNDPYTNDDDFLPTGAKRWTQKRYTNKLLKLGAVISKIGAENTETSPVIIGLAEVENKQVLSDLIKSKTLINEDYSYIHYDSLDERGIDVAFLYKSAIFKVEHSERFSIYLQSDFREQDYTRDILLVRGILNNETIHILVNHWSSRREGVKTTEHKRIAGSNKVQSIIRAIKKESPNAKIIVMGDFNDNPDDESITMMENESMLYNPFKTVWSRDKGSLNHNFQWNLFDQILFSTNFFDNRNSSLIFKNANVFNSKNLIQYQGKYKGHPFRTYTGRYYKGGYSDHFPVYIEFKGSL